MVYQAGIYIQHLTSFSTFKWLLPHISPERKARIAKLWRTEDQIRSIVAEALCHYLLKKAYRLYVRELVLARGPQGKPYFQDTSAPSFNISHAGNWVVCAVGDTAIGIDVEQMKNRPLPKAQRLFSEQEQSWIAQKSPQEQLEAFYQLWTLKESYIKKTGCGLSTSLKDFSFVIQNHRIAMYQAHHENTSLAFISQKLDSNHWYALCTERTASIQAMWQISVDDLRQAYRDEMR